MVTPCDAFSTTFDEAELSPGSVLRNMRVAQMNGRTHGTGGVEKSRSGAPRRMPRPIPRGERPGEPGASNRQPTLSAPTSAAERLDEVFFAAIEEDLATLQQRPAPLPVMPAVASTSSKPATAPLLNLADPIHAQMHDARRSIRSMWIGMALLILAVLVGVVWTTVRMDRADRLIAQLLQKIDAQQTIITTYKQENVRLTSTLADTRHQVAKLKAQPVNKAGAQRQKTVVAAGL